MRRQNLLFWVFALLLLAGCSKNIIINVDGMPVSNHEYVAQNSETGLRVSYVLARYYKQYEGDEYMLVPEYLNAWDEQVIDPSSTESLILHIKVVNLKRIKYTVWYDLATQIGEKNSFDVKNLYLGKLPRKDFAVSLPLTPNGKVKYRITFQRFGENSDLYEIGFPYLSYTTKGGVADGQNQVR